MKSRIDFYKASPGTVKSLLVLEEHIAKSTLEKPLIELVRLRASQINGCAYCVNLHAQDARKAGESEQRLDTLVVWQEVPFFSDRERAALEWTESLTLIADSHAPDDAWDAVYAQFSNTEIADLTLLISAINAWNRFAIAFRKVPA